MTSYGLPSHLAFWASKYIYSTVQVIRIYKVNYNIRRESIIGIFSNLSFHNTFILNSFLQNGVYQTPPTLLHLCATYYYDDRDLLKLINNIPNDELKSKS